jgi:hypothetical protein
MSEPHIPNSTEGPDLAADHNIRGGKGRRDEVGPTGIYPATGPYPEGDAPTRTPADINKDTDKSDRSTR